MFRQLAIGTALALLVSVATTANAVPIAPGFVNFSPANGTQVQPTPPYPNIDSLNFTDPEQVNVDIATGSTFSSLLTVNEVGSITDIPSLSAFVPILNFIAWTDVQFDLLTLFDVQQFDMGGTFFITMSGTGVVHADGFEDANAIFSWNATTTDPAADTWTFGGSFRVEVVPEPATLTLLGAGLAGIGFLARRRKQA